MEPRGDAAAPALRERPEDMAQLVDHILDQFQTRGEPRPSVSDDAIRALQRYPFPGNVRELENILERAITLNEDDAITAEDLYLPRDAEAARVPEGEGSDGSGAPTASVEPGEDFELESYLGEIERGIIVRALEKTRYNKTAAAEKLGISFRALRYRLKKLGLE
jgi:two-component system response regulator PilR (NtrC family)